MRRWVWVLGVLASSGAVAACASILGLDDGLPREDGGLADVTIDVLPSGDASADATPDASADAVADVLVDAPKPYSPIPCGNTTCNSVTQGCCRTGYGDDASPYAYACVNDAGACKAGGSIVVGCNSVANCAAQGKPGAVCCANTFQNLATDVSCVAPSACPDDAATILCGPGDDELCAAHAFACLPSSYTIVGWNICK